MGIGKPLKSILHMNPNIPDLAGQRHGDERRLAAEVCDGMAAARLRARPTAPITSPWLEEGFRRAGNGKGWKDFETPGQRHASSSPTTCARRFRRMKPNIALYVGGMGHQDKNFHNDMMVRRGYGDAAKTIQELYLADRKGEAIEAVPDEYCDDGSLVGPPDAHPRALPAPGRTAASRASPSTATTPPSS